MPVFMRMEGNVPQVIKSVVVGAESIIEFKTYTYT